MPIRLADSALQSLKKGLTILPKFRLLTFFRKTRTRQTQPNMKRIIGSLFAVAASVALVSSASALTWIEVGDAGQSIATSQTPIPANQPLNSIFGSFLSTSDVDIFTIFISNPALFSATTVLGTSTLIDTSLFLFNSSGLPVYMNDDAAGGGTIQSTLPAGNALGPQTAGIYYLAISLSDNEPVNFANQLLFALGASTSVRGPNPIATGPLVNWDSSGVAAGSTIGAYQINLTGASTVPEPSTLALCAIGTFGILRIVRRRKSSV